MPADSIVDVPQPQPAADPRDHRELGGELGFIANAELVGAGMPLWLANGAAVVSELERYITEVERRAGYRHVRTPSWASRSCTRPPGTGSTSPRTCFQ